MDKKDWLESEHPYPRVCAHREGLHCNVFWADTPEEAIAFRQMGIDTVLTNDFWRISRALKKISEK